MYAKDLYSSADPRTFPVSIGISIRVLQSRLYHFRVGGRVLLYQIRVSSPVCFVEQYVARRNRHLFWAGIFAYCYLQHHSRNYPLCKVAVWGRVFAKRPAAVCCAANDLLPGAYSTHDSGGYN